MLIKTAFYRNDGKASIRCSIYKSLFIENDEWWIYLENFSAIFPGKTTSETSCLLFKIESLQEKVHSNRQEFALQKHIFNSKTKPYYQGVASPACVSIPFTKNKDSKPQLLDIFSLKKILADKDISYFIFC